MHLATLVSGICLAGRTCQAELVEQSAFPVINTTYGSVQGLASPYKAGVTVYRVWIHHYGQSQLQTLI